MTGVPWLYRASSSVDPGYEAAPTDTPHVVEYRLVVADRDWERTAILPRRWKVQRVTWGLNGVDEAEVTIPWATPLLSALEVNGRPARGYPRLMLWRDGQLVLRGYPAEWDDDPVTQTSKLLIRSPLGLLEGFGFGDPERVNYADSDGAWTDYDGATSDLVTAPVLRGTHSLEVVGDSDGGSAGHVYDLPLSDAVQVWHCSTWLKVDGQVPYGVIVTRIYDGGGPGNTKDFVAAADPDASGWQRIEVPPIRVDPGHSSVDLAVKLLVAPDSTCWWDSGAADGSEVVRISRRDNTGVAAGGDSGTLVGTMLAYGIERGDLRIGRRSLRTGITLADGHTYDHAEHAEVLRSLDEWSHDVMYRFEHGRNRVVSGPYDKVGGLRKDLVIGPNLWAGGSYGGAVRPSTYGEDELITATTALGDADQSVTREEAGAVSDLAADVLREVIINAPDGSTPAELGRLAERTVANREDPGGATKIDLFTPRGGNNPGDWLKRGLQVGDRFKFHRIAGPWREAGIYRVTTIELIPGDEKLTIEAVPT